MIAKAAKLLSQLEQELDIRSKLKDPLAKMAENCFIICEMKRTAVWEESVEHTFSSDDEEIHFYKDIYPQFSSRCEYYSLLHHAGIFLPPQGDQESVVGFWGRQKLKLEKFIGANFTLYTYYKEKRVDKNKFYFIRSRLPDGFAAMNNFLAKYLALEKYTQYADEQLKLIPQKFFS